MSMCIDVYIQQVYGSKVEWVSLKIKRKKQERVWWNDTDAYLSLSRMISASSNNLQKNQHVITYETLKNRGYNYRMKMNARDLFFWWQIFKVTFDMLSSQKSYMKLNSSIRYFIVTSLELFFWLIQRKYGCC